MDVLVYPVLMMIVTLSLVLRDSFSLKALGPKQRGVAFSTIAVVLAFALSPVKEDYKVTVEVIATPIVLLIVGIPIVKRFLKIVG